MKKIIYIIFLLLFYFGRSAFSQGKTPINIGYSDTIYSKLLKENRPYWVYLPPSYNDKIFTLNKYPVVVLLDGDAHFHSATGIVDFLSHNHRIPEMIVIALPNTDRTRDLSPSHTDLGYDGKVDPRFKTSGGGDRFLAFIKEELLPVIDCTYRTMPYRILIGHSAGGNLAAHDFISEEPVFNAHLSIDPNIMWDNRSTFRHLSSAQIFPRAKTGRIYISCAHNSQTVVDTTEFRKAQEAFGQGLKKAGLPDTCYQLEYFEKENHNAVPHISTYHGLLFLFNSYPINKLEEIELSAFKQHYEELVKKYEVNFIPFEKHLNDMGYYHLYSTKNVKKAIDFFIYNTELNPSSYNVWDSLAEAYMVKRDNKKARLYYEKSLSINSKNENAVKMIKKLK